MIGLDWLLESDGHLVQVTLAGEELHQFGQSYSARLSQSGELTFKPLRVLSPPEPGPGAHQPSQEEETAVPGGRVGSLVTDCQVVVNPGLQLQYRAI